MAIGNRQSVSFSPPIPEKSHSFKIADIALPCDLARIGAGELFTVPGSCWRFP